MTNSVLTRSSWVYHCSPIAIPSHADLVACGVKSQIVTHPSFLNPWRFVFQRMCASTGGRVPWDTLRDAIVLLAIDECAMISVASVRYSTRQPHTRLFWRLTRSDSVGIVERDRERERERLVSYAWLCLLACGPRMPLVCAIVRRRADADFENACILYVSSIWVVCVVCYFVTHVSLRVVLRCYIWCMSLPSCVLCECGPLYRVVHVRFCCFVCFIMLMVQMSVLLCCLMFWYKCRECALTSLTLRSGGTVANEVYLRRGYC